MPNPISFGAGSARAFGFANLKNTSIGGWIRGETVQTNTIGLGVQVTSAGIYVAERGFTNTGTTNGVMNLTGAGAITWNKNLTYGVGGRVWDIGVDSGGNIYTLVYSTAAGLLGVVKMDSSGTFTYYRQISNIYNNYNGAVQINSRGLYVDQTGSNLYLCGQTTFTTASSLCAFASVTQSGTTINWSKTTGTASVNTAAKSIASDSSGNVYIGLSSAAFFGLLKVNSSGTVQWAVAGNTPTCLDVSGGVVYLGTPSGQTTAINTTTGLTSWQNPRNAYAGLAFVQYDIAVDSSGNVYTVGRNNSTPFVGNIIKYNSSGTLQWSRYFQVNAGATQVATIIYAVSVDNTNSRIIITGGGTSVNGSESACPFYVAALPMDGTGTAAYTISSWTYTYGSYSATTGTTQAFTTTTVTPATVGGTYTNTSQVTGTGSNTISTSLSSFA